jgi:hypothetical protein
MRHDEQAAGLWCTSTNEERWHPDAYFDEKEEAIAYGREEHEDEFYVGKCRPLTVEDAANCLVDEWSFESADQNLNEEFGGEDRLLDDPNPEQLEQLQKLVADWLRTTDLVEIGYFMLEDVERVIIEREPPR